MSKDNSKKLVGRFVSKGVYPHQFSFFLDIPLRRFILSPKKLAERLHLESDYNVLEIGPGSGYFSIEVAKRVPKGKLYLFDIQKEMLDKIRKKAQKRDLKNLSYRVGNASKLPYESNFFDVVYMVTVLGEIDDKNSCLKDVYRVLKKEGIFSVSEQKGDPEYIKLDELKKIVKSYGFEFVESFDKKLSYTANFRK